MRKVTKIALLAGATIASTGLSFSTSFADSLTPTPSSIQMPAPPSLMAGSAILIDAQNGQILYSKDVNERRAPASTTKLMTMFLVLQAIHNHKLNWTDIVPITSDAYNVATEQGVSDAYLDPKEQFTVKEMMQFVAVLSANDATVALADKVAGDQQSFVNDMNAEAQKLGLHDTHYMNVDGLPQDNHYSSAGDLARLAQYLVVNYPEILQFSSMPQVTVRHGNTWPNTDELIGHYQGVDGLKTGFTSEAGYCYVGTAQRNGERFIAVVMDDTTTNIHQRFTDAAALFDYGFNQFTHTTLAPGNKDLQKTINVPNANDTSLTVRPAKDFIVDLPTGVHGTLKLTPIKDISAPIKKGQTVGTLSYVVKGTTISSVPVVATDKDGKANWFIRMLRAIGNFFSHLVHSL